MADPGEGDLEELGILGYLYYTCRYLKNTDWEEIEVEEVMDSLESLADDLESLESYYLHPAPSGGISIREVMLEVVVNLLNAMEELASYMDDNQDWHLEEGLSALNASNEMVEALLGTVSQERLELAEMISRMDHGKPIGNGEMEGGKKGFISLTDVDATLLVPSSCVDFGGSDTGEEPLQEEQQTKSEEDQRGGVYHFVETDDLTDDDYL